MSPPYQGPYSSVYYCASCSALVTPLWSSQTRGPTRLPRRLPIPPSYAPPPPSPSSSTPSLPSAYASCSSSSSSLSLPSPMLPPCRSQASRPLPKMPKSSLVLEPLRGSLQTDEKSTSPTSPATPIVSTDVEKIRRGNLSKLRRHLGNSIPTDLVPPRWDLHEESESSSSDEEEYSDLPISRITVECVSELTKAISPILEKTEGERHEKIIRRYSRRWLREKKGRRWVEEDYSAILQGLRELRR